MFFVYQARQLFLLAARRYSEKTQSSADRSAHSAAAFAQLLAHTVDDAEPLVLSFDEMIKLFQFAECGLSILDVGMFEPSGWRPNITATPLSAELAMQGQIPSANTPVATQIPPVGSGPPQQRPYPQAPYTPAPPPAAPLYGPGAHSSSQTAPLPPGVRAYTAGAPDPNAFDPYDPAAVARARAFQGANPAQNVPQPIHHGGPRTPELRPGESRTQVLPPPPGWGQENQNWGQDNQSSAPQNTASEQLPQQENAPAPDTIQPQSPVAAPVTPSTNQVWR